MTNSTDNVLRFRDIPEGICKCRIDILIHEAERRWLKGLPEKNDFTHSLNVENNLDKLVPNKMKKEKFSHTEIFILLYAVYLHDIGRKIDGPGPHERKSCKEIKENYRNYYLSNEHIAIAIADVCHGHAKNEEKKINDMPGKEYKIANYDSINLQFLAALLRLADEIDNSYLRVQDVKGQANSIRNQIRNVDIDYSDGTIEFQSESVKSEDLGKLHNIKKEAQTRLDEIRYVLGLNGLYYEEILLGPEDFETKSKKPIIKNLAYVGLEVQLITFKLLRNIVILTMFHSFQIPSLKIAC